jgi:hypothetical protein
VARPRRRRLRGSTSTPRSRAVAPALRPDHSPTGPESPESAAAGWNSRCQDCGEVLRVCTTGTRSALVLIHHRQARPAPPVSAVAANTTDKTRGARPSRTALLRCRSPPPHQSTYLALSPFVFSLVHLLTMQSPVQALHLLLVWSRVRAAILERRD